MYVEMMSYAAQHRNRTFYEAVKLSRFYESIAGVQLGCGMR